MACDIINFAAARQNWFQCKWDRLNMQLGITMQEDAIVHENMSKNNSMYVQLLKMLWLLDSEIRK